MVREVHVVGYVVGEVYLYTAPHAPFEVPVFGVLHLPKVM